MDPTKPILNLQGTNTGCFYRDVHTKPPYQKPTFQNKYQQIEYERNFFKDQYQRLYQAYQDLKARFQNFEQLKAYISQLEAKIQTLEHRTSSQVEMREMRILEEKNGQLKETILNKNYELENAYRRIEEEGKRSSSLNVGMNRRVLASVDKLEDGVKEAIFSNFELLKNNAIGELRSIIKNQSLQTGGGLSDVKAVYSNTYTVGQPIVRRGVSPAHQTVPPARY